MATLFSRMRRSAAEIPWGTFARVVSESMGAQTDVAVDVAMQLREWGAHLTTNALRRWTPAISMPSPCESTDLGGRVGRGKTCGAAAIVRCDICGGRRCLAHARVDYMADAICDECIGRAKARWRAEHGAAAGDPPQKGMSVTAAYAVLGLRPGAGLVAVKREYRRLVVKHNADRPQSDAVRERNTKRLKSLNEAFKVLERSPRAGGEGRVTPPSAGRNVYNAILAGLLKEREARGPLPEDEESLWVEVLDGLYLKLSQDEQDQISIWWRHR